MRRLAVAFTHPTYDYIKNYNPDEFLGDQLLNTYTAKKAISKHPNATEEELSNLLSFYKSNDIWRHMMTRLKGVNEFIRMAPGMVAGEDEIADVFEALFGGVYSVVESIQPGMGDVVGRNLYEKFFHDFRFNAKYMAGNPKTVFWQMFEGSILDARINDDIAIEAPKKKKGRGKDDDEDWKGKLTVKFMPILTAYLNTVLPGKKNNWSETVFEAVAATRGTASTNVYEKIVNYLAEGGMTQEFSERQRYDKYITDSGFNKEFREKEASLGIGRVIFKKTKSSSRDGVMIHYLIGVFADGEKKVLEKVESTSSSKTHPQARKDLIAKFVGVLPDNPRTRDIKSLATRPRRVISP